MTYIAYDQSTGKILYYYSSSGVITSAPDGLGLLMIDDAFTGDCINTHHIQDGEMVLVE